MFKALLLFASLLQTAAAQEPLKPGTLKPGTQPATQQTGTQQTGTGAVLMDMASRAAIIFCGQVMSVARHDAAGVVEITFRVDQAIKGSPGATYVLREWAGRWVGHGERYAIGSNLLLLLTAPGPAGLSAPVDGGDGAIPVIAGAAAPGPATPDTLAAAPDTIADLRLLAARAERNVTPAADTRQPATPWVGAVAPLETSSSLISNPALQIVVNLLRGGA